MKKQARAPTPTQAAADEAAGAVDQPSENPPTAPPSLPDEQEVQSFAARMQALREATPIQVVKMRPEPKSDLLGMVVKSTDGALRTSRMKDWRTEEVHLRAGDAIFVMALVGDDLPAFEEFERRALEQKQAAAGVTP